ncbi:MAG: diguanylate cyclase, partial [Thermoanaerobaculia bacterium]
MNSVALATHVAQTIGAAVIALLLYGFLRQYGKSYLSHWTASWAALAVYRLSELAWLMMGRSESGNAGILRTSVSVLGGVAGFLQLSWLAFGVYEILRRRPVRIRTGRRLLLVAVTAGVISGFLSSAPGLSESAQLMARVGIRNTAAAVCFFIAGWAFWTARRRREGVGFTMVSIAFLIYGMEKLHYIYLAAASLFGVVSDYTMYLGYFDFLLQAMLGMGMVASLLEDEREASELATVEIEHLAYHDALTGLPNRPLFLDRLIVALAQAARANQKLAVLFMDLDRFKAINDSLGHSTGDLLLKAVADRIRRCVREGDTIARFGGDEFTLLIPRIENIEDVAKIAQKIIETLKIPFMIAERELFVTTSIGIGLFPGDGTDPETLVRNADSAMYRAKDQGRDNYQLYAPAMNARALETLALENMLRRALSQNELVLHYQPLVDASSRNIVGLEALIRWNHPELGLLSPAHFISAAEVSGLIVPIGNWVLLTACRQLKTWQKRIDPDLTVAVNLSARQFHQGNLANEVMQALEQTGLDPASLELEITESSAMQNAENS